jgi:hypothetical protein
MGQHVVTRAAAVQRVALLPAPFDTWFVGIGRAALVVLAGLVATSAGAATGCGPSFQAVYECDVNFEHCYALDQGSASPDAMKACWRDWLHGYTYGQSRDRVEYAATRFSELSLDPTLPGEDTQTRPKRTHSMVAPLPTSAFAPPPNVASEHGDTVVAASPVASVTYAGATGPARVVPVASRAPGEQCTSACGERWNGCRRGCADGACDGCDRSYRECVPACFREAGQAPRSLR